MHHVKASAILSFIYFSFLILFFSLSFSPSFNMAVQAEDFGNPLTAHMLLLYINLLYEKEKKETKNKKTKAKTGRSTSSHTKRPWWFVVMACHTPPPPPSCSHSHSLTLSLLSPFLSSCLSGVGFYGLASAILHSRYCVRVMGCGWNQHRNFRKDDVVERKCYGFSRAHV